MITEKKRQIFIFLIFTAAALSAPFFLKGNYLLNVLVFFGMGAYISGIITARFPVDPFLVMILAALCSGALAFVIGFPILKLKGHYLAMATLGFGIIMYIIFNETVELTGGPSGLSGIPNLHIGSLIFDNDLNNYYLVWTFTLAVMLLSINLSQSRIGRALRAIHDSEVAARVMGVNARILKVQIFAVSAVISAVAGSLYAHIMTFIAPASFGFNFSVELLTMVVVGGLGSIYGSFLGAAILTMLPELLRVFQNFDIVIYGLMLILMTMFMPGGLVSGIGAIAEFIAARMIKRKDDHAQA